MTALTEKEIDWLALEGNEIIGFKSGSTVNYDLAGYDRCRRDPVPPETLPARDLSFVHGEKISPVAPAQSRFEDEPYLVRIAGFRRRNIFGPDEIGAQIRRLGIPWSDGLGNGLYESLLIARKYGLNHVLEAPIIGIQAPFLDKEWPAFREFFTKRVERWAADLREMEAIYKGNLTGVGKKMVVLSAMDYPLAHFVHAYERNPHGVEQALLQAIGRVLPPVRPQTSEDRAALVRFWTYIRENQSRFVIFQAETIRRALGPETLVVANVHELPPLDMEGQAQAYDYPAVAIRPLLLDDPVFLRHYIAYFTQLYRDLTGKPPMVSVRMNLSAATPQYVPTGDLIRYWYDQAVRHGAGGFYFWTRDYPTSDAPGTYDGSIPGNPVPATLPKERWEATLKTLGLLSTHQQFVKPAAEVAILVPYASALLQRREWRQIYAAFSAMAEARIHTRFLSDRQIEQSGVPEEVKLLLVPVLEFVSPELRRELEGFAARGRLLGNQDRLFDRSGQEIPPLQGMEPVEPQAFDLFALEHSASFEDLGRAASALEAAVGEGPDLQSWVFEVTCDSLPESSQTDLRDPDLGVEFAPWLYEHGSEWIMPYL